MTAGAAASSAPLGLAAPAGDLFCRRDSLLLLMTSMVMNLIAGEEAEDSEIKLTRETDGQFGTKRHTKDFFTATLERDLEGCYLK